LDGYFGYLVGELINYLLVVQHNLLIENTV